MLLACHWGNRSITAVWYLQFHGFHGWYNIFLDSSKSLVTLTPRPHLHPSWAAKACSFFFPAPTAGTKPCFPMFSPFFEVNGDRDIHKPKRYLERLADVHFDFYLLYWCLVMREWSIITSNDPSNPHSHPFPTLWGARGGPTWRGTEAPVIGDWVRAIG